MGRVPIRHAVTAQHCAVYVGANKHACSMVRQPPGARRDIPWTPPTLFLMAATSASSSPELPAPLLFFLGGGASGSLLGGGVDATLAAQSL